MEEKKESIGTRFRIVRKSKGMKDAYYITYDNLTLSEVIEGLFLPHVQNDCKIAVSSSSQSLIEFIYFILAICDSPC